MPTLFYLPLEPIEARYTTQLSERWMPDAMRAIIEKSHGWRLQIIQPIDKDLLTKIGTSIRAGVVLDATGRGIYSMQQCEALLLLLRSGNITSRDVIFFQDFWTPGMDAIFYALHLYGLEGVRIYSTVYAQSVDEYDFTYPMREWIRPIEVGLSRRHTGIFVASTIHKDQLRAAGFSCPIYVTGLTIGYAEVAGRMPGRPKSQTVAFTSRIDAEKNPHFMLSVARGFLAMHPDWSWILTTSREKLVSNDPSIVPALREFAAEEPRFILKEGLTKNEYYAIIDKAAIQFNSSFQDYVAYSLLEACIAGCDIVYPDFRSFPEVVPDDRRYKAWDVEDALRVIDSAIQSPRTHKGIPEKCNAARYLVADILIHNPGVEVNIWKK